MRTICLLLVTLIISIGCGAAAPDSQNLPAQSTLTATPIPVQSLTTPETPTEAPTTEPTATPAPIETPTVEPTSMEQPSETPEQVATVAPASPTEVPGDNVVVEPSALADEITMALLVDFKHSVPEYTRAAQSALISLEDRDFCRAAEIFLLIADDAKAYGERLTSATYNAGVIYMAFGWNDSRRHQENGCIIYNSQSPRGVLVQAGLLARGVLEEVQPHLNDDQMKSGVHLMLGRIEANAAIQARDPRNRQRSAGGPVGFGPDIEGEKRHTALAIENLCLSLELDSRYEELVRDTLASINSSCG